MTITLIVCAVVSFLMMGMFPIPLNRGFDRALGFWFILFCIVCTVVLPVRYLVLWIISLL